MCRFDSRGNLLPGTHQRGTTSDGDGACACGKRRQILKIQYSLCVHMHSIWLYSVIRVEVMTVILYIWVKVIVGRHSKHDNHNVAFFNVLDVCLCVCVYVWSGT